LSGLTVDQYNEMTKLTASDAEFNNIYQVYKQMLEEGVIAPPLPTTPLPTAPVAATVPAAPVVATPPAAASTTVVAPVSFGTKPVPPGLPMRPYSPPSSH
jgi:hypothetical protein